MRRPQITCDDDDSKHHGPPQSSSGALDRMRRFLAVSLRGRQSTPETLAPLKRSCESPPPPSSQVLSSLRIEAENILGRSLEDLIRDEDKELPHRVPSFIHDLCCYMLTHGVDYDTLVAEDLCTDRAVLVGDGLSQSLLAKMPPEHCVGDPTIAARLFRLFLQELPHPLLNKEAANALFRLCKALERYKDGQEDYEIFDDMASRFRRTLCRKVPPTHFHLLQYLTAFLHQIRNANHNTCPVAPSSLSRLLGRVLTEKGECDQSTFRLAEVLLLNHPTIFRDQDPLTQDPNYSSDSVSSNCDSRGGGDTTDEADLFTPDDDDDDDDDTSSPRARDLPPGGGEPDEDDSTTTTTTDTDDFRSPPVSPIKRLPPLPVGGPSTSSRSTDELQDGQGFVSKIAPYGKDYLPSITGLLSSPYESWSLDSFRSKEDPSDEPDYNADSSCISGEEISELESEGDRDADGSETEGVPELDSSPCPHEERRSAERFQHRGHYLSTDKKPKRRTRRKHTKEHAGSRVPSSEEEERETPSSFAALLSSDPMPTPFDPTPQPDHIQQEPFSALLSSVEPVTTSDRASWGLPKDDDLDDNWQRTAPFYSRKDEVAPISPSNWYCEEDRDQTSLTASKFSDPSIMKDSMETGSRSLRGHTAVKLLTKNVNSIKRKIKKFEEEFETTFGYRPSHSDKMKHKEIKKYLSDLSKAKKELKQMKDDIPDKKVKAFPKPSPCSISLLRCQESTGGSILPLLHDADSLSTPHPVTKDTYRQVEDRLSVKRCEAGRPTKVADLTIDQLKEEKTDIQKALLFYESIHGRPFTREDKELVRPLYDRYRLVKRSVNKFSARSKESVQELAPILEHVVMDFTLASPQHRGSLEEEEVAITTNGAQAATSNTYPINPDPNPDVIPGPPPAELNLGDLHALPIHELKERKKEARDQKRRLRRTLRELEERFERETGRKMQKEDRGPLEKDYNEYKHMKAKLRLLEALLSKHDS